MADMLTFMTSMIDAIADFLWAEPVRYIVGFILAAIIVRILQRLVSVG